MIEIKNLHKHFKKNHVLKGIDLSVKEGETVAIIGPSGSGKSTLLRCINLLETPSDGILKLDDLVIDAHHITKEKLLAARRNTAMVFQNYNLFANKTAIENIAEALITVKKMNKKGAMKIAEEFLGKVGLENRAHHYPYGLSGGQQQRVAIARALALNPKVILFDEPTSALDPELVQEVLQVIRNVAKEKVTMIIVTHELEFAKDVAHKIVFMDEGLIVEQNSASEFFASPREERTRKFIDHFIQRSIYYI
ncbi:amino acid ABC transporter ATP-binding protein [Sinanaerobacter chloroacetimidivorans]|uniref:Amino acid ABC transporter ATP-binding protein n=1 Tax=Sinanaerobacter chloroacetimidivorans TaxID=2818044 RepID=A0A8J7W1N4_9FIRM|nr:amino acid ABC transporter ATP-binding protein [Sinanaerobacter chloroacetimidivorans]MBR0597496.1 amino acid ABC transporter ATP-binding protein [Sinanaerobacter chloroacetimidivorans]